MAYSPPGHMMAWAFFRGSNDKVIIIRNHELSPGAYDDGPFGKKIELLEKVDESKIYDLATGKDRLNLLS